MNKTDSILVTDFGGYDCLQVTEHPLPELKENELQIEVHYCGLNFADLYTRQGLMPQTLPFVLGMECSGIIKAVGSAVENTYKPGTRVICYNYNGGMFRYIVNVPSQQCYSIPDDVTLETAASLTVNYLTAYFSLMHAGQLRSGQNILINSCAGGVGWAATQLAKLKGAKVYGTTSALKTRQAKSNGVDYVLSYENIKEQLSIVCPDGLDLIIDNEAGKDYGLKSELLKPFGRMVFIGSNEIIENENRISMDVFSKLQSDVSISSLMMNNTSVGGVHLGIVAEKHPVLFKEALGEIFKLLSESKISPKIDSVWPFHEIVNATRKLQERKNVGKILLRVRTD